MKNKKLNKGYNMQKNKLMHYQPNAEGGTFTKNSDVVSMPDLTPLEPEEEEKQRERLTLSRVRLLLNKPFFGNLATRLELIPTYIVPTAGTDGRRFFYNPAFVKALNDQELLFLCGHEVLHCVFDHFDRREDRNPQIYNMAGDYVINLLLVEESVGEKITTVPILLDYKYSGMVSEEIYDLLIKDNNSQNKQTLDVHFDADGKDGEGDEAGNSGDADSDGGQGSGKSVQEQLEETFGKMSNDERKQFKDELKEAIIESAEQAGAGNTPAGIKRMIKEWTEPVVDWRTLLRTQCESSLKEDFTFMRPSRKSHSTNCIIPGMNNAQKLEVDCSIDMSGSISNAQAKDFLGEVKGIMNQFTDYILRVWCFDTDVYGMEEFTPENVDEIDDYQTTGGGGTDFECNWKFMKENDIEPKQFILFTDGYPCGGWGDAQYCDTVFLIHGNQNTVAPFGITVHYEEPKEIKKAA